MTEHDILASAVWRKSSYSGGGLAGGAECVEVAPLTNGQIAIRNSKRPNETPVLFTRADLPILIRAIKGINLA
jgi:hypothetical protein